jgi:hypothetical protein
MKGMLTRTGGLSESVMNAMTDNWQTTAIIAAQLVIPPDAIRRTMINQATWGGKGVTEAGVKTRFVGQAIFSLVKKGRIESRKINANKFEYRLPQSAETTPKDCTK